jgi:preprotein translocase subunit SecY
MANNQVLLNLLKTSGITERLLFTVAMILLYRLGAHIPVNGVDHQVIAKLFGQGNLLGFIDLFSGGSLARFSIFAMGIIPFINASIIMQLLKPVVPQLNDLYKEGEAGRKQVTQYTRYLTLALALFEGLGLAWWLRSAAVDFNIFFIINTTITLTAGALFVMWLAELITERGVGNGASLLIFVGIVAAMPTYISNTGKLIAAGSITLWQLLILLAIFAAVIVAIIYVQEGYRKIPVTYAKRQVGNKVYGGQSTHIPMKLNQGGVLPIIFASSILMIPTTIYAFVKNPATMQIDQFFSPGNWLYNLIYFLLIFFFCYFYAAIIFEPVEVSKNLEKNGGFIPGIRPGKATSTFFDFVLTRITFIGALYLGLVAIIPTIAEKQTGVTSFIGLGSTALIIMVGVAIDTSRQIQTMLVSRQYEGFLKRGKS